MAVDGAAAMAADGAADRAAAMAADGAAADAPDGAKPAVAIALGANLGDPAATLIVVRPLLASACRSWWQANQAAAPACQLRWSPLFRTAPVGGPAGQPPYLNAAVVLMLAGPGLGWGEPAGRAGGWGEAAAALLERLQALERQFGRLRRERWGPRSLDLDLLWCGPDPVERPGLSLPHPRLQERSFVLAPLAAIDPGLRPPGPTAVQAPPVAEQLQALLPQLEEPAPERLGGRGGWPE